jgi:S-adenosylmethionine decarboxylase proenzyme
LDSASQHLLVEYYDCDAAILDDRERVAALMRQAAQAAGATVVAEVFHPYAPQGVTGVLVIEESHLSIHTWPEYRYAAVDFFTCGDCTPELAERVLFAGLSAQRSERLLLQRGLRAEPMSMRVARHESSLLLDAGTTLAAVGLPVGAADDPA